MQAQDFFEIDPSDLTTWVIPLAVGLGATVLVLLVGWIISRQKRAAIRRITAGTEAHDPFTEGTKQERRGASRRGGNPIAILISDAEVRATPSPGWVIDRSTGGLCLSVNDPIVEGTILSVRTSNAPETIPWVQLEVKNCRLVGREYELGCQFVRTPPWSVLLLFG
jgi:hypothetical protein